MLKRLLCVITLGVSFVCVGVEDVYAIPMEIPIIVVRYFPIKGERVDQTITGDWGASLQETRAKTEKQTEELIYSLEEGSRYHAYKNPNAQACLKYRILADFEFREPMPVRPTKIGETVPLTDYNAIMCRIDIRHWVEERGVKEVWIWGYHGGKVGLWESNMAGPFGDISNSNRDPTDLPILKTTYTVYHYNYQRGTSEACENHMHQIEHVLNYVDGRDRSPPEKWADLLFWGKFVGSDKSHKIVHPGCGWAHYPPNGEKDYDWANPRFVETDIEDWRPDGSGTKQRLNSEQWQKNSLKWFVYWMQSIPGSENGLQFEGKPLRNWWMFIGDFDNAMSKKMTLVEVGGASLERSSDTSAKVVRVPANADVGVSTGISVSAGDVLHFDSKDQKWCACDNALVGTDGLVGRPNKDELPVAVDGGQFGQLAGGIGNWKFLIGSTNTITMKTSGELYLLMNDRVNCYFDNTGAVDVKITRVR